MGTQISLATLNHIYFVSTEDILFCKSNNSSTTFYLNNETCIVVSKGIKKISEMLDENEFIRPHQSYLVNKSYITQIEKLDGFALVLKNKQRIPISMRRRKTILDNLKEGLKR